MLKITGLEAKVILSSAGNETVEAAVTADGVGRVTASVPAGISAGKYEVKKVPAEAAAAQITQLGRDLAGEEFDQRSLDKRLMEAGVGGNASLAVSAAFWKAGLNKEAAYTRFPKLLLLLFEGGEHGNKNIAMQEFTIIEDSIEAAAEDFDKLRDELEKKGVETLVGAEGGFSPSDFDDRRVLETIKSEFPDKKIALDAAGSFKEGAIDYGRIIAEYNIASIEDPFSDEEWDKWQEFYAKYGEKIMVVGDDLTVTNPDRIRRAINPRAINAVIIKPDQIGTISGALEAVSLARENKLAVIVSHRGEDTDDDWIADFAVAARADGVKFGGMDRGERIAKYNRLRELGMK